MSGHFFFALFIFNVLAESRMRIRWVGFVVIDRIGQLLLRTGIFPRFFQTNTIRKVVFDGG